MGRPSRSIQAVTFKSAGIPNDLRALEQFVVWRYEHEDAAIKKPPFDPKTGRKASVSDPATWSDFDTAVKVVETDGYDGIGFVLTHEDPYCVIDLDHCVGEEDKTTLEATAMMERFPTYWELSPSGTGVHGILKSSSLPACFQQGGKKKGGGVELFVSTGYATMTGLLLPNAPADIRDCTDELAGLCAELFPEPRGSRTAMPVAGSTTNACTTGITDEEVIERARKDFGDRFGNLYDHGDLSAHGQDHSKADMALAGLLTNITQDGAQIERVMSASALGGRGKWQTRSDYRKRTIQTALVNACTDDDPDLNKRLARCDRSDSGNGERFVARHGADVRYVKKWRRWYVWDGRRFVPDDLGRVMEKAKATATAVHYEAATIDDKDSHDALTKWAIRSRNQSALCAMIANAETDPTVATRTDAFDLDPFLLCVENGVIDLRTGRMREHRRKDMISKMVPIVYDETAKCPLWEQCLEQWIPDPEVRDYIQRAVGYSLMGDVSEQVFFLLLGNGSNGKSVFRSILEDLLGEYATQTGAETLMRRKDGFSGIPNNVAALVGRRLVTVSELAQDQTLNESLIKDMTGGDTISARFLHGEFFTFRPTFKIWLAGNAEPEIRGTDEGIWRRVMRINFDVTIPENQRNKRLPDKLRGELPGILAWAVRGCLEWQRTRLNPPASILRATRSYRESEDALGDFLSECCVFGPSEQITKAALWQEYDRWCAMIDERTYRTQRAFNAAIKTRPGITDGTSGHDKAKTWFGIGPKDRTNDPTTAPTLDYRVDDGGDADASTQGGQSEEIRPADRADRTDPSSPFSLREEHIGKNLVKRSVRSAQSAIPSADPSDEKGDILTDVSPPVSLTQEAPGPVILHATEEQIEEARRVARGRQAANYARLRSHDYGADANYLKDFYGSLGELLVRDWLRSNGIDAEMVLVGGKAQPVPRADFTVNGVTFDIKTSRPEYEYLTINYRQHKKRPSDYYLPVLFEEERTARLCHPVAHAEVGEDPWTLETYYKNGSRFYSIERETLRSLTSIEGIIRLRQTDTIRAA